MDSWVSLRQICVSLVGGKNGGTVEVLVCRAAALKREMIFFFHNEKNDHIATQ